MGVRITADAGRLCLTHDITCHQGVAPNPAFKLLDRIGEFPSNRSLERRTNLSMLGFSGACCVTIIVVHDKLTAI